MKKIVLLIVLGIAAYVGYGAYSRQQAENPETIQTPVYAEFRVGWRGKGREVDMVLFGEMASQADCQLRSAKVWDDVIATCKECTMQPATCKADLAPRYKRLFDQQQVTSTYLSFTRADRFDRNGRLIIYGLTSDEGNIICDNIRAQFQQKYKGAVSCIRGRGT
jgi:hypothetical protein